MSFNKVILLNLSNLSKGGGIQVGLSMISSLKKRLDIDFVLVGSSQIMSKIGYIESSNFIYQLELNIRGFNLFSQLRGLIILRRLEAKYNPIGVLTLFGPTFFRPKCTHVVGFAQGHLIYSDSPYWDLASRKTKLIFSIKKVLFKILFNYSSDIIHIESESAAFRLKKYLGSAKISLLVANNFPHEMFDDYQYRRALGDFNKECVLVTIVSAYYAHKNLEIVNQIVNILKDRKGSTKIRFRLTIDDNLFHRYFVSSEFIENVGFKSGLDLVNLYRESTILLMPSLLEIFPGNFLEAMMLRVPIVTTDLDFAHSVCGDAALYYSPRDPLSALAQIVKMVSSKEFYENMQLKGSLRVSEFNTSQERFDAIINSIT